MAIRRPSYLYLNPYEVAEEKTAESVLNQLNCSVLAIKPEGFVSPVTI